MNQRYQHDPLFPTRFFSDEVARYEWDRYYLELDAIGRYFLAHLPQAETLHNDWPKLARALKQMSQESFFEFCGDIVEEISRRNNDLRDGMFFLPSYDNVSLGRNHTRRKLASIPPRRFHDLCIRICFEIGQRCSRPTWAGSKGFRPQDPISKAVTAASVEQARLLDNYHRSMCPTGDLSTLLDDLQVDSWLRGKCDSSFPDGHHDRFAATTSAIYSLFESILQDHDRYEALLQCRDDAAQQLLDLLQMLLDCPKGDSASKKSLLVALQRLSSRSRLHPRCFILNGIIRGESPVCGGAFSDIWKGDFNGQPVCLKVLKMYKNSNRENWLKVFSKEAVLWSHISHPNLLPFYGIFHLDEVHGRICLVSPWMNRGNINEYLVHAPTASRLLLIRDIATGLSYLHERGIVHGDLKGVNILVTNSGRACLSDFGSSIIQDAFLSPHIQPTSSGSLGGTIRWQAPELHDPEGDFPKVSPESDVYAYSCVLYEVYTGQVPFYEYARDVTVILQVMKGQNPTRPPPNSPSFSDWGLTERIWSVMKSSWQRDPRKRPSVATILKQISDSNLVDPRPMDDWEESSASKFRNSIYRNDRLSTDVLETVLSWV